MMFFLFGDSLEHVNLWPNLGSGDMPLLQICAEHWVLISVDVFIGWLMGVWVDQWHPYIQNICAELIKAGVSGLR